MSGFGFHEEKPLVKGVRGIRNMVIEKKQNEQNKIREIDNERYYIWYNFDKQIVDKIKLASTGNILEVKNKEDMGFQGQIYNIFKLGEEKYEYTDEDDNNIVNFVNENIKLGKLGYPEEPTGGKRKSKKSSKSKKVKKTRKHKPKKTTRKKKN